MEQLGKKQSAVRQANVQSIIGLLRKGGKTFLQLEKDMGLSNAAIYKIIKFMENEKLIVRNRLPSVTSGRKAELIELNANYNYFGIIKADNDYLVTCICDFMGKEKYRKEIRTGYLLKKEVLETELEDLKLKEYKLNHLLFIYTGKYDKKKDKFVFAEKFSQFYEARFRSYLESKLQIPVEMKNDMSVAVLPELNRIGGLKDFIYLNISEGVGGAVVSDGHVFEGEHGMAGEFGWFGLNPLNATSFFPNQNSFIFNEVLSFKAMVKDYCKKISSEETDYREQKDRFVRASQNRDQNAIDVIKRVSGIFSRISWSIMQLLDITNIILEGDIILIKDIFEEEIKKQMTKDPTHSGINIIFNGICNSSVMQGAIIEGLSLFDLKFLF